MGNVKNILVNKPKKNRGCLISVIVFVVVIVLLIVGLNILGKGKKSKIASVTVEKAHVGDMTATLDTTGSIGSEETKIYSSPVNAVLSEVGVGVGQTVKAGDYLVWYDTSTLENSYLEASLQQQSSDATNKDTINKSNDCATQIKDAEANIENLNNQIAARQAEVDSLNELLGQYQNASNQSFTNSNNTSIILQNEIFTLTDAVNEYESKIRSGASLSSEENSDYTAKKARLLEASTALNTLKMTSDDASALAANISSLQGQIESKSSELAGLKTQLAEQQSVKAGAENGVMSSAARASLNYSSQANSLKVTAAENDLATAKAGVVADFDGIVSTVEAVSGAMVTQGQAMVSVASSRNMRVTFAVPKSEIENVKEGQSAVITVLGKEYKGTVSSVSKIAAKSEAGTSQVSAYVHIDNPDDNLIIGIDAKLNIELDSVKNAVLVPVSALNTSKSGDFVYVVEDGKIVKKDVKTGLFGEDYVEIIKGISEGEDVITTVDDSVIDGALVNIKNSEAVTSNTEEE